jgi:hypothetical protein
MPFLSAAVDCSPRAWARQKIGGWPCADAMSVRGPQIDVAVALTSLPKLPWVCRQPSHRRRPSPRYFQRERLERRGPGSTLRSCTLPTTRPTLYAEWTDIELVRELSPGRAEVPVSYWQRRCRRQALHFNRPTVFLAGAFLHSQSHGRASQHDRIIFAVTREKRHEDSLFSDIGDAGGLRTRRSRS